MWRHRTLEYFSHRCLNKKSRTDSGCWSLLSLHVLITLFSNPDYVHVIHTRTPTQGLCMLNLHCVLLRHLRVCALLTELTLKLRGYAFRHCGKLQQSRFSFPFTPPVLLIRWLACRQKNIGRDSHFPTVYRHFSEQIHNTPLFPSPLHSCQSPLFLIRVNTRSQQPLACCTAVPKEWPKLLTQASPNATSGIHNCWMSVSQLAFEAALCSIACAYCRGLGAELSAYCAEFRDLA